LFSQHWLVPYIHFEEKVKIIQFKANFSGHIYRENIKKTTNTEHVKCVAFLYYTENGCVVLQYCIGTFCIDTYHIVWQSELLGHFCAFGKYLYFLKYIFRKWPMCFDCIVWPYRAIPSKSLFSNNSRSCQNVPKACRYLISYLYCLTFSCHWPDVLKLYVWYVVGFLLAF